jgi:chitinase
MATNLSIIVLKSGGLIRDLMTWSWNWAELKKNRERKNPV